MEATMFWGPLHEVAPVLQPDLLCIKVQAIL